MNTKDKHPAGGAVNKVEVTELSDAEWRAAAKTGLRRLGLTFDELAKQAARRQFANTDALKMWRVLGGERP